MPLNACTSFSMNEVQNKRKGRDFPFYGCTSPMLHEPQDEGRGWKILFRGGAKKP